MAKDIHLQMWIIIWHGKPFCYFDRANSIKTNLRTCKLQTIRSISYKSIKQFWLNLPHPNGKKFSRSMLLACHKKSYLICDEITNFRIFTKPIPIFFQSTKMRQPKQGRDSCLKINRYYIIFQKFVISHISNNFSYDMPAT